MGVCKVRTPFGSRDTMVGGSGAAQPRHGSSNTGPIELTLRGIFFHNCFITKKFFFIIDLYIQLHEICFFMMSNDKELL